ncbi:MAG: hypothetical protein M3P85_02030 [Actinomycetota bacterium]|nr:hypothetical protein [Actinomycetota bacterium]
MAEKRRTLSETQAMVVKTSSELSSALEQLTTSKTHEGIDAAVDQLEAIVRSAGPLPVPPMSQAYAHAWEALLQAAQTLAEAAGEGELALQPQVDGITEALDALLIALQEMTSR